MHAGADARGRAHARTTPRDLLDLPAARGAGGHGRHALRRHARGGLPPREDGSLTGVTALTGVVTTADGRQLAFATLLDGMAYGQTRPQAAIDEFVDALAECGCGG